jgi:hypothetical protein
VSKSAGLIQLDQLASPDRKVMRRSQDLLSLLAFASERVLVAFVYIASDFCRLHDAGKQIDRCPRYYASERFEWHGLPAGMRITEWIARDVLALLEESLGADLTVDKSARAKGLAAGSLYHLSGTGHQSLLLAAQQVRATLPLMLEPAPPAPRYGPWLAIPAEKVGRVSRRGTFICCPVHNGGNEREASAILNTTGSQAVFCFACDRAIGSWKQDQDGTYFVRLLLSREIRDEVEFVPESVAPEQPAPPVETLPDDPAECAASWEAVRTKSERSLKRHVAFLRGQRGAWGSGMRQHESTMKAGVAPVVFSGRRLGMKRSVHRAAGVGGQPTIGQSYAGKECLGDQISSTWKKHRKYGHNELSDKYVEMAAKLATCVDQVNPSGYVNADNYAPMKSKDLYPDLYCSLHYMSHREEVAREQRMKDGTLVYRLFPKEFVPVAGEWILIDIDHLDRRSYDPTSAEGKEIEARMIEGFTAALSSHYTSQMFSGGMNVVETSKRGLQITLQLSTPMTTEETLREFYDSKAIRRGIMALGEEMRKVIGRGGVNDPAVHTVGRLFRLPGPRIDKEGNLFIARPIAIIKGRSRQTSK